MHLDFQRSEPIAKRTLTRLKSRQLATEPARPDRQRPARPLTMTLNLSWLIVEFNFLEPDSEKQNGPQMRPERLVFGGEDGSRTRLDGFAGRCITALLPRQRVEYDLLMWTVMNRINTRRLARPGKFWSGRRVSNSRPQPWQGCALPTELLPRFWLPDLGSNQGPTD